MPDGVNGIDDLKVMISADSEKLGQGIAQAKDIVAKFADMTGKDMSRFEGYLDKAGAKVDFFKGKLTGWIAAFEMARAAIDKVVAHGQKFADETGTQDSYKEVTDAWSSLKDVLDTTLGKAFAENKDKASAFSASISSSDEASLTSSLDRLQAKAITVSGQGMQMIADKIRGIGAAIDSFNSGVERKTESLERNIKASAEGLAVLNALVDEVAASGGVVTESVTRKIKELEASMKFIGLAAYFYEDQAAKLKAWRDRELADLEQSEEAYRIRVRRMQLEREKVQEELSESWPDADLKSDDRDEAAIKAAQSLDRETEALKRRAQAIGMTAAQRAEFEAVNKALDSIPNPRPEDVAMIREHAAALRAQAEATNSLLDAEKQRQGLKQITDQMERELETVRKRILMTREAAGAAEELAAREKALTLAQQRNIGLTPEMVASIDQYATSIGRAARELDTMKKQLDTFKETGQVVTRTLESAFRQWTEGSKVDVREMVRSMLADLAMLTFRKNVSDVLGGGITSGLQSLLMGGGGAAFAGAGGWQTTVQPAGFLDGLFSGFRADGGPVEAGRMYMVGERGPEPFIPKVDGTILPSGSRISGQSVMINTTINAPGATAEAAAMIERQLAAHEARLPGLILETTREARERGFGG